MSPLLPLLAIAALAVLFRKKASAVAPAADVHPVQAESQRVVRETKEILDGKRTAYTDPEQAAAEATARAAAKIAEAMGSSSSSSSAPASSKPKPPPPKPKPRPLPGQRPSSTAPSSSSSSTRPTPAPAPSSAPPGTDLALARSTAPKLAAHLKAKGRAGYDRKVLKLWQIRAGIASDGIYGRGSAAALKYFTPAAPAAFFAQGAASYTPPKG